MDFQNMTQIMAETRLILDSIEADNFRDTAIALIQSYEYQGLDVRSLIKTIYSRGLAAGRPVAGVREDIWKMILLFLCRGNNISKMLTRSKDDIVVNIRAFKTNYQLQDKVGTGGSDRVTLSRVAAVFPGVTLKLLSDENISASIPRAVSLSIIDFGENFPKVMQTVIVASVFPKSSTGKTLMKALLLYMIEENKLLSRNTSTQNDNAILIEVMKYAKASFMSTILPFDERLVAAERHHLIVQGSASAAIVPAANTFDRKYPNADLTFMN
ncbi:nucleocapsid protein [Phasivirus baduense]|uniref:Nucleoprotein n=1 Tax=Phasivirus baduense TaxID=3052627 RepID=A0A0X9V0K0_9VIRU|nr:nucleocapsid protein [Phasivirus baduense]AMA19448.1 nucleocapsid protein [Phasivirus baduense]